MRVVCIGVLAALTCAAPAAAAPVLELHGSRVVERDLRFAGPSELPAPPAAAQTPLEKRRKTPPKGRPTRDALDSLLASGQIDQPTYDDSTAAIKRALRAYRELTGTRRAELGAVIANCDSIATAGKLTSNRLSAVSLTLARNTEWW